MDLNTRGVVNYLLLPISGVFYALSSMRRMLYRIGVFTTNQFKVPVVVVGNITVGGSGKTPIVIKLVKHFQQQDKKVGVVSRGYGGSHASGSLLVDVGTSAGLSGDEPLLIAMQTDAPVMINKDRSKAVYDLIEQCQPDVVISDDGLQHYAMGRDIEIAVVDGRRRFGNGFYLPAGPLRESQSRLNEVDFVINNGAIQAGEITARLEPKFFVNVLTGEQQPLDFFIKKVCHGVAGIGHPQRFFDVIKHLCAILYRHKFKDHHPYVDKDLAFDDEHPIIMTAKDCVKCSEFANDRMWYLHVEVNLSEDFLTKLDAKL